MHRRTIVRQIIGNHAIPRYDKATAFASSNIALIKYWGKRNQELNLPITNSLSVSLAEKGCSTTILCAKEHSIHVNGKMIAIDSTFGKRLIEFLSLFDDHTCFSIDVETNIPIAAGLASSACGFAALVKALNKLYQWQLPDPMLSILARLGSGSASRSIMNGFVEWHKGENEDGMDSYAEALSMKWPELCVGLVIVTTQQKVLSSRVAMQQTVEKSCFYPSWPKKVATDLQDLKIALKTKDFFLLGKTAENNALAMHATMAAAWPPIVFSLPESLLIMQKVWCLRQDGVNVFFTQDAGPNLKLLFLRKDLSFLQKEFPDMDVIEPFNTGEMPNVN